MEVHLDPESSSLPQQTEALPQVFCSLVSPLLQEQDFKGESIWGCCRRDGGGGDCVPWAGTLIQLEMWVYLQPIRQQSQNGAHRVERSENKLNLYRGKRRAVSRWRCVLKGVKTLREMKSRQYEAGKDTTGIADYFYDSRPNPSNCHVL